MNTWAPLFSKIVDSSLWEEPDNVVKVFLTMLAKKDADNVVRGSAFNISRWSKKTEAETMEALKILQSPDTRRLEPQAHEGRRIEKVDEGWLILNGQFYQELMRGINRKAYKAQKQSEYRARKKGGKGMADAVSGAYRARERRYVAADKEGDFERADAIAAEGIGEPAV